MKILDVALDSKWILRLVDYSLFSSWNQNVYRLNAYSYSSMHKVFTTRVKETVACILNDAHGHRHTFMKVSGDMSVQIPANAYKKMDQNVNCIL